MVHAGAAGQGIGKTGIDSFGQHFEWFSYQVCVFFEVDLTLQIEYLLQTVSFHITGKVIWECSGFGVRANRKFEGKNAIIPHFFQNGKGLLKPISTFMQMRLMRLQWLLE